MNTGVTLILTGLTPFDQLPSDASLSAAFDGHGMNWIKIVIDVGAVIGLTTTLFLGLYSQSRMYLAMARDSLLPKYFSIITLQNEVPKNATMLCAVVAGILALCFDVNRLSSLLDMGILLAYSVVCACVLVVRAQEGERNVTDGANGVTIVNGVTNANGVNNDNVQKCYSAVIALALLFLFPGCAVTNQWNISYWILIAYTCVGVFICGVLIYRVNFEKNGNDANQNGNVNGIQIEEEEIGKKKNLFYCPFVPVIPAIGLASNSYLMTQRPWQGWLRLVVITGVVLIVYVIKVATDGRDGRREEMEASRVPLLLSSIEENASSSKNRDGESEEEKQIQRVEEDEK